MKIEFVAAVSSPVAQLVNQDAMPAGLDPVIAEGAKANRFAGKAGQLHEGFISRDGAVVRMALAGAGEKGAKDRISALERAGAAITAKYIASGVAAVSIDLTDAGLSAPEAAAVILGARLRGWRYDIYRTKLPGDQQASLTTIRVVGAPEGSEAAWAIEEALADGVELTRELVTEPANIIYPESFVARVSKRLEGTGMKVRVLEEAEMKALGMGALLGVAQGSVRSPRLLVMEWDGGKPGEKPTAFVGKGVTFDTGGISIKPAAGMEDMKWDMGGAGAVAGA
ncbi:MAG: M17 family peptidase N-terminal domain-containing protein, partial [Novosphingobium sp.]|uniref:leucyl aminopeptidase family protein n=1 Tax=Novosphingobium sp. TaxID=1874826 RepID=UPI0032B9B611